MSEKKNTNQKPACEFYEVCPFFLGTLSEMPHTADVIRRGYCYSPEYKACARYVVTMEVGANHVTNSLYPHNKEKAEEIIVREGGRKDDSQ